MKDRRKICKNGPGRLYSISVSRVSVKVHEMTLIQWSHFDIALIQLPFSLYDKGSNVSLSRRDKRSARDVHSWKVLTAKDRTKRGDMSDLFLIRRSPISGLHCNMNSS